MGGGAGLCRRASGQPLGKLHYLRVPPHLRGCPSALEMVHRAQMECDLRTCYFFKNWGKIYRNVKFTICKGTVQLHFIHSEGFATIITIQFQNIFISPKGNPGPFSCRSPSPPPDSLTFCKCNRMDSWDVPLAEVGGGRRALPW